MQVHELRQLEFRTTAIRAGGFFVAALLILGCGIPSAWAGCGVPVRGAAWKYGTTAELISWDGRWWADSQVGPARHNEAHSDPESKPCSRCGGRPVDDHPVDSDPVGRLVRSHGRIGTIPGDFAWVVQDPPHVRSIAPSDQIVVGRSLEVAKRPPRGFASI